MNTLSDTQRETILRTREAYLAGLEGVEPLREAYLEALEAAREAGATNQEIGDLLGVARQRVSQLLKGRGEG